MAVIDWTLVEKIVMRELTRLRGANDVSQAAADQQLAQRVTQTLQANPCDAQARILAIEGFPLYRVVACFAAMFARMSDTDKADILSSLSDPGWTTCLSLGLSYGSQLSMSSCPQPVMGDPAYATLQSAKLASWNPYDAAAGDRWTPGYVPGGGGAAPPGPGPLGTERPPGEPPAPTAEALLAMCQGGDMNACNWLAFCMNTKAEDPSCAFYCDLDPGLAACAKDPAIQPTSGSDAEAKRPWYKHPVAIAAGGAAAGLLAVGIAVKVAS